MLERDPVGAQRETVYSRPLERGAVRSQKHQREVQYSLNIRYVNKSALGGLRCAIAGSGGVYTRDPWISARLGDPISSKKWQQIFGPLRCVESCNPEGDAGPGKSRG